MEEKTRHEKFWAVAQIVDKPLLSWLYGLEAEPIFYEGPALIIANHSNDLDPLILAACFPKNQMYFVASEHIFRLGIVSKVLAYLVAPIPRKKASSGADTVKACLRALKAGNSVALMAEGEATWDGVSIDAFSATGKLAKSSGASLITVKITGGYLSNPRWSHTNRRGKVYARPVHIYSPLELEEMSAEEVLEAINHDIYEDCWQRQRDYAVRFVGKDRAEDIERAVYICPTCKSVGTIVSSGNTFCCTACHTGSSVTEYGTFADGFTFSNISEWDKWQKEQIRNRTFETSDSEIYFRDFGVTLKRIGPGHKEEVIGENLKLCQYEDRLTCGVCTFYLSKISNMSIVQAKRLLFSYEKNYYEIKVESKTSVRKYLEFWEANK